MTILDTKALFFSYDQRPVLQNWSCTLASHQICHLKGANGSGKSTLLRLLAGILLPFSGSIDYHMSQNFSYAVAYVGHQLGLHPDLTVNENLSLGITKTSMSFDELLNEAGLKDYESELVGILSVGQKQKVALIRMILQDAMIWMLDEPLANLDETGEAWFWKHIDKHVNQGGSVILTAHQRHFEKPEVIEWHLA
jgi:heme exporter protein A